MKHTLDLTTRQVFRLEGGFVDYSEISGGRRGPQGPPGPPGTNGGVPQQALLPFLQQAKTGSLRVLCIGDSNMESVLATGRAGQLPQLVAQGLRDRMQIAGDTGVGYVPAGCYLDPPTGGGAIQTNGGGLDYAAVVLAAGDVRTWPSTPARYLEVSWSKSIFNRGIAEVLVDGTVVGTLDASDGTEYTPGLRFTYDAGSVAVRTVAVRGKAGSTGSILVEGIAFRTAQTGVSLWNAARSGSRVKDYSENIYWRKNLADSQYDFGLVIAGFGGNDMGDNADWGKGISPKQWGQHWAHLVSVILATNPHATIIPLIATERLQDVLADPGRVGRYEKAMAEALAPWPGRVFPIYESRLWTPDGAAAFNAPSQWGWLGDDIHRSQFGINRVASYILDQITGVGAAGTPGAKGDKGDPGAGWIATSLTVNTDESQRFTPGTYLCNAGTATASGFPGGGVTGILEIIDRVPAGNAIRRWTPTLYSGASRGTFISTQAAANTWGPWRRLIEEGQQGSGDLVGTGSPLNVVTPAGAGVYYTDTASTCGATRWVSTSAASNSWQVCLGDTGWRSLTLINGWDSASTNVGLSPAIRRVNNTAMIRLRNLRATGRTSTVLAILPVEFMPPSADGGLIMAGVTPRTLQVDTAGNVQILGSATADGTFPAQSVSYTSARTWPTTLPGSPA